RLRLCHHGARERHQLPHGPEGQHADRQRLEEAGLSRQNFARIIAVRPLELRGDSKDVYPECKTAQQERAEELPDRRRGAAVFHPEDPWFRVQRRVPRNVHVRVGTTERRYVGGWPLSQRELE